MKLKETIDKIDALKKDLDELGPLPNDAMERLEQKIRMEWNYHSNVIEGNQLDYGETRSLLLWGITAKGKSLKDHLDLEGHNEAIKKLEAIASKDIAITESLIKEFHKLILAEPFEEYRKDILVGKYKETDNYLYNERKERIDFCSPSEVPQKLNELINWTNNAISPPKRKKKQYDVHPLLIASTFHYEFINIHPFDDGNGRLARIFMNLILMQCEYPPIIIHNNLKTQYFSAIEQSRGQGIEVLADFLGEQLIKSLELYLKAANGESIEEADDLDKKIELLNKLLSSPDEKVIAKSPELTLQVFDSSIVPLIDLLTFKLQSFNTFFTTSRITLWHGPIGEPCLPSNIVEKFRYLVRSNKDEFYKIEFSWEGFNRAGTKFFSLREEVVIEFGQFHFNVYDKNMGGSDRVILTDLYSKQFSEEGIKEFVNKLRSSVLEKLKNRYRDVTGKKIDL